MHFTLVFDEVILHKQVRVVRSGRIILGSFDHFCITDHIGQTCHGHETLLSGCHDEVQIVLIHIDRDHSVCGSGIYNHDLAVFMSYSTDFSDRVQNAGACFMVAAVYNCDVRISFDRFFSLVNVDRFCDRQLQVYMIHVIIFSNFCCSGGICTIIENQDLLSFRYQRVYTSIDIDRARSCEQDCSVLVEIAVDDLNQVFAHLLHDIAEFFFSRADIRNYLCIFNGISCCSRTWI